MTATEIYIARQPIYDRRRRVVAYELLYRTAATETSQVIDGDRATAEVMLHTLTTLGLDTLTGPHLAFINITRNLLLHPVLRALPPERVVLEVLEDVAVDPTLMEALRDLATDGYQIALDDFVLNQATEPLVDLAHLIKLDVLATAPEELGGLVARLRRAGVRLLAEKIETPAMYARCRELGFDYYQGYHFAQPRLLRGHSLPTAKVALLPLIGRLNDPEVSLESLESLIERDATLSYKLLRYLNSAFFHLRHPVDGIHRAVVTLGLDNVRAWATLLVLTSVGEAPNDLAATALLRAGMCRALAKARGLAPETGFIVGLLSILDNLLTIPMDQVLEHLPLEQHVNAALLDQTGPYGPLLCCTLAYERGDWVQVDASGISAPAVRSAYLEGLELSSSVLASL